MNRIFLNLLVVLAATLVSCKDDDDDKPSYSFKDQEAQGKIGNESWTFDDGYALSDQFFAIYLTRDEDETGCDIINPKNDRVSFIAEFETKVYELGTGSTVYTVTLTDAENLQDQQISIEGAIEITAVTATHVSGRLDARVDEENFINGNFTVPICK